MSIAEFIDGMPSFDERNFSRFQSKKGRRKHVPVYIPTDDKPCVQIIVDHQHNQWNEKPIAEFIDGMPSFDVRNFSRFQSKKGPRKVVPVYING